MKKRAMTAMATVAVVGVMAGPAWAGPSSPTIIELTAESSCIEDASAIDVRVETRSFQTPPTSLKLLLDGDLIAEPDPEEVMTEGDQTDEESSLSYFATFEFAVEAEPGTYDLQVAVGDSFGETLSEPLEISVEVCETAGDCEPGEGRYGKRILDCLGEPYGQIIRERASEGDPAAEGARRFWQLLVG